MLGGTDARGKGEESGGMNMKGKLRSESLPSAIYDAIVIRARLRGRRVAAVGLGRNENVARKTHSRVPSLFSRIVGFLNAPPHQQLELMRTQTSDMGHHI